MTIDIGPATAGMITLIWATLWSFAMEYFWFFKDWVDKLDPRKKQGVNALGIFVIVTVMYLLSLFDVMDAFTPNLQGLLEAFVVFFVALGVGQGVHLGTKSIKSITEEPVVPRGRANPE